MKRLVALRELQILETPEEESFDRLTRLGARLFGVPICLISLVDEWRQWFKAKDGPEARETPRSASFCAVAMGSPNGYTVLDATRHERFQNNPLVTGPPGIRFYAGAPLVSKDGYPLGTFCVIDLKPHPEFGAEDQKSLADLAALTVLLLEARLLQIFRDEIEAREKVPAG